MSKQLLSFFVAIEANAYCNARRYYRDKKKHKDYHRKSEEQGFIVLFAFLFFNIGSIFFFFLGLVNPDTTQINTYWTLRLVSILVMTTLVFLLYWLVRRRNKRFVITQFVRMINHTSEIKKWKMSMNYYKILSIIVFVSSCLFLIIR